MPLGWSGAVISTRQNCRATSRDPLVIRGHDDFGQRLRLPAPLDHALDQGLARDQRQRFARETGWRRSGPE